MSLPSPTRWKELSPLLDSLLDADAMQRAQRMAELRQRDASLARDLDSMLGATEQAKVRSFLSGPSEHDVAAPARLIGKSIGPYVIQAPLGQGGTGTIWRVRRADGRFTGEAAIKLLHLSLMGRAGEQRFTREGAILAQLSHPHIARMLDAGVTEDGRPFLVLELVEGLRIDQHCDTLRLSVRQRLRLFLDVLEAAAHAHRHLVIHRDIKPTNILVTGEGRVKLLDFGIAKLLHTDSADMTLTAEGQRALTPGYAAPEQVLGGPITTATDVYALGVLLYLLLAGRHPTAPGLSQPDEIVHATLKVEPPPLSKATTLPAGDKGRTALQIAHDRRTSPARLRRQLEGDLDNIVSRAMHKEAAARYASVEQFAADIQRHLGGLPIQAQPPSRRYRAAKFLARHRLALAAAAAVTLSMVVGLGAALWQGQQARVQAAMAQRESQRAQAVQTFLLDIFRTNSVQQADPLRARQTTARELLDVGAKQAAQSLQGSPEAQDEVLDTLADMYYQLGLGEQAAAMRQQRVAALKQAHGPLDARVAAALLAYAHDVAETDLRARSSPALAEARQILDHLGDHESDIRGRVLIESAGLAQYESIPQMRRFADDALSHYRAHPGPWFNQFHSLQAAARSRYLGGDYHGAAALHREALALVAQHTPSPSAWAVTPRVQLAEAQWGLWQLDAAEDSLRTALALSRQLDGNLAGPSLQTQAKLGGFLHSTGRLPEGRQLLDQALAGVQNKQANATPNAQSAVRKFRAIALLAEGRIAEAEPPLKQEIDDLRAYYPDSLPLSRTLLLEAAALSALGRQEEARRAVEEAWRLFQAIVGDAGTAPLRNRYLLAHARVLLAQGDAAAAERRLSEVVPQPADLPVRAEDAEADVLRA